VEIRRNHVEIPDLKPFCHRLQKLLFVVHDQQVYLLFFFATFRFFCRVGLPTLTPQLREPSPVRFE